VISTVGQQPEVTVYLLDVTWPAVGFLPMHYPQNYGDKELYEEEEVKDMLAYLKPSIDPSRGDLLLYRIMDCPDRKISESEAGALTVQPLLVVVSAARNDA
jgi:hypothetical protein